MSTLSLSTIRQNFAKFDLAGLGIPVLVLLIMAMLVLPAGVVFPEHRRGFQSVDVAGAAQSKRDVGRGTYVAEHAGMALPYGRRYDRALDRGDPPVAGI